ncbi:hypothetical protein AAU57_01415 [Nonlabens sp. YIK11]|uniref:hypothetical protein n=1 Tax=Nonlabens sp. YIK11 TaxID=1453349 RepID=UPI0006DCFD15|nr:hypothetical protein [Nonlabens sp. YIK11]KQC32126.1 hypothetical protein AAU57_01415 [Nonlabens sp. YIK11]
MPSIENSIYRKHILKKLEFRFGEFYLCKDFIVSEVYEGFVFGVEEATQVVDESVAYYNKMELFHKKLYIANRIHKYSVKPTGWLKFGHLRKYLYGYCVVDDTQHGVMSAILESKFVPIAFKSVTSLGDAIDWALKRQMK